MTDDARKRLVGLTRYGLPAVIVIAGLLVVVIRGPEDLVGLEAAAMLVGAGLSVYLFGWLMRVGLTGDEERDREEEARRYFDEHGRWPD
jgi:hypothetical protein